MEELISKRSVIEAIEKARANVGHNLERSIGKSIIEILDDVGRDIDRLPSAEPPRIRGQWSIKGQAIDTVRGYWATCSACGHAVFGSGNYCSNCGSYNKGEVIT